MAELMAVFEAWRDELDSVPFAHEDVWIRLVGDVRKEDTP